MSCTPPRSPACPRPSRPAVLASLLLTAALLGGTGPASAAYTPGIQWLEIARPADVDAALARARQDNKPLFLYWGAQWCPPCQHLRSTLFVREDFRMLAREFIAVHIDGDLPGAQRLGERFRVRGYPSMLLLSPQGEELTRLPGELDAALYVNALRSVLGGSAARSPSRPVRAVLTDALDGRDLPVHEWRQLAWYAWDSDDRVLAPGAARADVLARLARACPAGLRASQTRLLLRAVAAAAQPQRGRLLTDEALREAAGAALLRLLGDGGSAREHMDLVTQEAPLLLQALTAAGSPQRRQLQQVWEQAARRLAGDATLSRTDRLGALQVRVDLAGLDRLRGEADVSAALREEIRQLVAQVAREAGEPAERQSVIPTAARLLADAGLTAEAQALLTAELPRSLAPHFLMGQLARLAQTQGRSAEALRWSRQAWESARGPATRLQWGSSHLGLLIDSSPEDGEAIEQLAGSILAELGRQPDVYHERNVRELARMASRLRTWQAGIADGPARLERLAAALQPVCEQQRAGSPPRRQCEALLAPRPQP